MMARSKRTQSPTPIIEQIAGRKLWTKKDAPLRRFRIWDNKSKKTMQYRYYISFYRAVRFALAEVHFQEVGHSLTVYDVLDGLDYFTFKHHANGDIGVVPGKSPPKEQS
jgi:hypothetical protein